MTEIKFNIPDDKVLKLVEAFNGLYPRPATTNEETDEVTYPFNENEWVKECVRRFVVSQEARYRQIKLQKSVPFSVDETLIN